MISNKLKKKKNLAIRCLRNYNAVSKLKKKHTLFLSLHIVEYVLDYLHKTQQNLTVLVSLHFSVCVGFLTLRIVESLFVGICWITHDRNFIFYSLHYTLWNLSVLDYRWFRLFQIPCITHGQISLYYITHDGISFFIPCITHDGIFLCWITVGFDCLRFPALYMV